VAQAQRRSFTADYKPASLCARLCGVPAFQELRAAGLADAAARISITKDDYALSKDGMKMFSVMERD
jgi:hypothetical protein